jgi:hypothetical protein
MPVIQALEAARALCRVAATVQAVLVVLARPDRHKAAARAALVRGEPRARREAGQAEG